jgi:hypothetical protein
MAPEAVPEAQPAGEEEFQEDIGAMEVLEQAPSEPREEEPVVEEQPVAAEPVPVEEKPIVIPEPVAPPPPPVEEKPVFAPPPPVPDNQPIFVPEMPPQPAAVVEEKPIVIPEPVAPPPAPPVPAAEPVRLNVEPEPEPVEELEPDVAMIAGCKIKVEIPTHILEQTVNAGLDQKRKIAGVLAAQTLERNPQLTASPTVDPVSVWSEILTVIMKRLDAA